MAIQLTILGCVIGIAQFCTIAGAVRLLHIPSVSFWQIGSVWLRSIVFFAACIYMTLYIADKHGDAVHFWYFALVITAINAIGLLLATTSAAFDSFARNWRDAWIIGLLCAASNFILHYGLISVFGDYPGVRNLI